MRPMRRKRGRTVSVSPPLRPFSDMADGAPSTTTSTTTTAALGADDVAAPTTFMALLQFRQAQRLETDTNSLKNAAVPSTVAMRYHLLHMQTLQEVLRRTSLAEMRDREVVEWLIGTEQWLREMHQPLAALSITGTDSAGSAAVAVGDARSTMHGGVRGINGGSSISGSSSPIMRAYSTALSELRLLVIWVLHTMPWWRVVEDVAKSHPVLSSSSGGGGRGSVSQNGMGRRRKGEATATAAALAKSTSAAMDRAAAARHAITRWHVRLQVAFERVCLLLIDKSQHTVRSVLEVLLKPCQLRPPVQDGARRSIPSDSFIRMLNAIATRYGAGYVMELLEGCIADFMPRRRWVERRHHVACTAVLLYVALEGQTPAYNARLGNSRSLQRAVELLKSLRGRSSSGSGDYGQRTGMMAGGEGYSSGGGGGAGSPWRLPPSTRRNGSDDSSVDASGGGGGGVNGGDWSSSTAAAPEESIRLGSMLPRGGHVLPPGYVSANLGEDARLGGARLRQPALSGQTANVSLSGLSETEGSDGGCGMGKMVPGVASGSSGALGSGGGKGTRTAATTAATSTILSDTAIDADMRVPAGMGEADLHPSPSPSPGLDDVSVEHNNKLLAYRNPIIRVLLNRLLEMEQSLEPRDAEADALGTSWSANGPAARRSSATTASLTAADRRSFLVGTGSPASSLAPSILGSPASLLQPASAAGLSSSQMVVSDMNNSGVAGSSNGSFQGFPSAPLPTWNGSAASVTTAISSARSSPAALSPAQLSTTGYASFGNGALSPATMTTPLAGDASAEGSSGLLGSARVPLEQVFNALSQPYLRILRDCATLVYGRLADDLRRQQVAGACGNADWWTELLYFYLTVVTRVERPVYLLYVAPSLAMLGTEDEPIDLLHKLITLVTKGNMPVEQPRTFTSANGGVGVGSGFGRGASAATQPVRMRMAAPTGASRRVITLEERLRAARHLFPLFRFLSARLDGVGMEGVRRRLLKWTAQEVRRIGHATGSGTGTAGGTPFFARSRAAPSRESRLTLVLFSQCAAMSELMDVELVPSALHPQTNATNSQTSAGTDGSGGGGRFTTTPVSGDATDAVAQALQPLLNRYTLRTEMLADDEEEEEELPMSGRADGEEDRSEDSGSSAPISTSTASPASRTTQRGQRRAGQNGSNSRSAPPRRRLDLHQMEVEGLLLPMLMTHCPWQAWLR